MVTLESHSRDLKHACQHNWLNNMQVERSQNHNWLLLDELSQHTLRLMIRKGRERPEVTGKRSKLKAAGTRKKTTTTYQNNTVGQNATRWTKQCVTGHARGGRVSQEAESNILTRQTSPKIHSTQRNQNLHPYFITAESLCCQLLQF